MDGLSSSSREGRSYNYLAIAQATASDPIRHCKTNLEKAAHLRIIFNFSYRSLASYFDLCIHSIELAVKAVEEGRPVGIQGSGRLLSNESESRLVDVIVEYQNSKTSLAPAQVIRKAREIYRDQEREKKGSNFFDDSEMKFSFGWYHCFLKRHENRIHTGPRMLIEAERAEVPREKYVEFFGILRNLITKFEFPPCLVANMDETSIELTTVGARFKKCVIPKSESFGYVKKQTAICHVTLAETIFADGQLGRRYVLFPRKKAPKAVAHLDLPKVVLEGSDRGWMTSEKFGIWVDRCFLPDIEEIRRNNHMPGQAALLLIDGHKSRICPGALMRLREANVVCLTLVAHGSHVLQPLDVGVNSPFKSIMGKKGSEYKKITYPDYWVRLITESNDSLQQSATTSNIRRGFELSGIYPLNSEKILEHPLHAPKSQAELGVSHPVRGGLHISSRILTDIEVIHEMENRCGANSGPNDGSAEALSSDIATRSRKRKRDGDIE